MLWLNVQFWLFISFACSSPLQRIASKQNQIGSKTSDWRNVALGNPDEETTNTEDQDDIEFFSSSKLFVFMTLKIFAEDDFSFWSLGRPYRSGGIPDLSRSRSWRNPSHRTLVRSCKAQWRGAPTHKLSEKVLHPWWGYRTEVTRLLKLKFKPFL